MQQAAPPYHEGLEAVRDTSDLEVVTAAHQPKYYYAGPNYGESPPPAPKSRICGLSRPIFWLAFAMTALALGMVALGVGLGVSLNKAQNANASAPTAAASPTAGGAVSSSSPSTTQTPSTEASTGTASSTTASSTSSTSTSKPTSTGIVSNVCPGSNGTTVSARGDMKYLILCDMDFGSGKTDLSELVMETWDECLTLCNTMNYRQVRTDVGPSWNFAGTGPGGPQTPGTCWCLGGANKKVVANKGSVVGVPIAP